MLILEQLRLKNFRCHKDKTFQFTPGVNGIVGDNGSGKSSIMESIGFAFTGEGYDPKNELIRAGSEEGFVSATFSLNDKQGEICRWANGSKVTLAYDGKSYNKATEVKDLWASLLQIDSHIFQHVIMARQGNIAELFSGDNTTREKAFHKIFMVPNTEKLRGCIWENYIKDAPMSLPEEDAIGLSNSVNEIKSKLPKEQAKLAALKEQLLSEAQIKALLNSINYLERCIESHRKKPNLEAQLLSVDEQLQAAELSLTAYVEQKKAFQLTNLVTLYNEQVALKANQAEIIKLTGEIAEINKTSSQFTPEFFTQLEQEITEAALKKQAYQSRFDAIYNTRSKLYTDLHNLQKLKPGTKCPYCSQEININNAAVIADIEGQISAMDKDLDELSANPPSYDEAATRKLIDNARKWVAKQGHKEAELIKCQSVEGEYNEVLFKQVEQQLKDEAVINHQIQGLKVTQARLTGEKNVILEKIANLVFYAGDRNPTDELAEFNEVYRNNELLIAEHTQVERDVLILETQLQSLAKRLITTNRNHAQNIKKDAYVAKLQSVYNALHLTKFPRCLVQSYSTVIEEALAAQLTHFALPYTVSIGDDFKFVIKNDGEEVIPALSGGQSTIVGLCLRLALHAIFSKAFSMLAIDEGTTYMDTKHTAMYFECLKKLKNEQTINQVIIVEHNPMLAEVVDNLIRL